jgi:hypothetical protein
MSKDRLIVNDEWESVWKEAVLSSFVVLSRQSPGGSEKSTKGPLRIARVPAEVRTGHLPYTGQKLYRSSQLARQLHVR